MNGTGSQEDKQWINLFLRNLPVLRIVAGRQLGGLAGPSPDL